MVKRESDANECTILAFLNLTSILMEMLVDLFSLLTHLDVHLAKLIAEYGAYIYFILFLIIFCETGLVIFPFLPGDSLLFVAGALAAGHGLELKWLLPVLLLAAYLGNNCNYWIGRKVGPRVFRWENSRFFKRSAFLKTHDFYERHGGKTIIAARFLPILRTFAPFVAGIAQMSYRRFFLLDLFGGGLWIISLILAGYFFGNLPWVKDNLFLIILFIIALSMAPLAWMAMQNKFGKKSKEQCQIP